MTEFNLSDARRKGNCFTKDDYVIWEGDIKEFIRLLKETLRQEPYINNDTLNNIFDDIDKLAGNKLI